MNIECVICLENLQPSEKIYNTPCGHVFHYSCVCQWFQKSFSCPECRKKVPGKRIHRIYFNFVNEGTIMQELTSILETEIQTLQDQLTVKDRAIAKSQTKEQELSKKNDKLQRQIDDLTTEMRVNINKLEDLDLKVQSAGDDICEIIKKLRVTIQQHISEKSPKSPETTNLILLE